MRILLLSPDYRFSKAIGSELFRDEIARQHKVVRVTGPAELNPTERVDVPALLRNNGGESSFDLLMVHHLQFSQQYDGIAELSIPTCCWMVDYFPRHRDYKNNILNRHDVDCVFVTQQTFVPECQKNWPGQPHRVQCLPFSVDPFFFFRPADHARSLEFSALFSAHAFEYPHRAEVIETLADYGHRIPRPEFIARLIEKPHQGIYHNAYARMLGRSKIGIASLDQHGSCNMRHYEIPMAGAMLLTDGPPEDFEALGFREGIHYVLYKRPVDLPQLIDYYMEHDDERLAIAKAGQELVLQKHTNEIRVQEMTRIIEEVLLGRKA